MASALDELTAAHRAANEVLGVLNALFWHVPSSKMPSLKPAAADSFRATCRHHSELACWQFRVGQLSPAATVALNVAAEQRATDARIGFLSSANFHQLVLGLTFRLGAFLRTCAEPLDCDGFFDDGIPLAEDYFDYLSRVDNVLMDPELWPVEIRTANTSELRINLAREYALAVLILPRLPFSQASASPGSAAKVITTPHISLPAPVANDDATTGGNLVDIVQAHQAHGAHAEKYFPNGVPSDPDIRDVVLLLLNADSGKDTERDIVRQHTGEMENNCPLAIKIEKRLRRMRGDGRLTLPHLSKRTERTERTPL